MIVKQPRLLKISQPHNLTISSKVSYTVRGRANLNSINPLRPKEIRMRLITLSALLLVTAPMRADLKRLWTLMVYETALIKRPISAMSSWYTINAQVIQVLSSS